MNEITLLTEDGTFDRLWRVAAVMADGKATVPVHLQGKPADCFAICLQASQWQMNPFAVAQKTHLVSGTLGYEAQLVNAVISSMAPIKGRLNYCWDGDWDKILGLTTWDKGLEKNLTVTVFATMKNEDEPRSLTLSLAQASVRNSPLWKSDPRQQLAYLAVKRWSRLHTPDVIMGVYTPDELEERPRHIGSGSTAPTPDKEPDKRIEPPKEPTGDDLTIALKAHSVKLDSCDSIETLKAAFTEAYRWARGVAKSKKYEDALKSIYDYKKESFDKPAPTAEPKPEPGEQSTEQSTDDWLDDLGPLDAAE